MQLRILSARLNESKISKATRIVNRVPKVEQPHFVEQILKLGQKSPEGSMGLEALDILSKIHTSEREDAVNQYLRLMNADATASRPFAKSFQIISRIPTDHRSLFVDQVFRLIRPTMTLAQQVGIISALNEVRPTEHDAFIVQTLRLNTPDDTNHENVLKVAQALSRLNADVRSQFIDFVFHDVVFHDVVLALGEGNKKNIELMARIHFLRSQAVKFLSEKYEEDADLFDDIEDLTQKTRQHLSGCFDAEVKANYPDLSPETITKELGQYFEAYFEEDTSKATPIRLVQDYIHDWEEGLLKDLQTWIEANPTPTFEMTLKGA